MKYFKGKIINGKLILEGDLSSLPENKDLIVNIQVASEKKTREQLGYFFAGIVREASKYFGWDEDEMYNWLISECNKQPVINKFTGEVEYVAFGLSHCDKAGMIAVIEKAIRLLAEHGFVVKEPFNKGEENEIEES